MSANSKGDEGRQDTTEAKADLKLYGGLILLALLLAMIGLVFATEAPVERDPATTPTKGVDPLSDPATLSIIAADDEQKTPTGSKQGTARKQDNKNLPAKRPETSAGPSDQKRSNPQSEAGKGDRRDSSHFSHPHAAE